MLSTPRFRTAALGLPFALVLGCGDGGPTGPLNELSPEAALDAFDALTVVSDIGFTGIAEGRVGAAVRAVAKGTTPASLTVPVNETEPCPLGGSTNVSGVLTIDDDTFDGSVDFRQDYANCRAASSTGREWTFNGSPNVRTQMTFNGDTFAGSGTMTGGFTYSSEGESGRCTVSLTLTITQNGGSITGTACGQPINETFDDDDEGEFARRR